MSRDAEDKAKLKALQEAARVGMEDIANGRYRSFENSRALCEHLAALTEAAITGHSK